MTTSRKQRANCQEEETSETKNLLAESEPENNRRFSLPQRQSTLSAGGEGSARGVAMAGVSGLSVRNSQPGLVGKGPGTGLTAWAGGNMCELGEGRDGGGGGATEGGRRFGLE
jgi:hypothetical protein